MAVGAAALARELGEQLSIHDFLLHDNLSTAQTLHNQIMAAYVFHVRYKQVNVQNMRYL